jgi:hypothetical protein
MTTFDALRVSSAEAVSRYQRPVTCFHAKVAGVTYDNRQAAIAKLVALETLDLVPEPDNPHDPNAIKVCRTRSTGNLTQVSYDTGGKSTTVPACYPPSADSGTRQPRHTGRSCPRGARSGGKRTLPPRKPDEDDAEARTEYRRHLGGLFN